MNVININVDFKRGIVQKSGISLKTGDYNSTKVLFSFDDDTGVKIFEIKDPFGNTIFEDEIVDNELILARFDQQGVAYPIFTTEGIYVCEISLYKPNSKLTSASTDIYVTKEQVVVNDEIVETYTPMFDNLLSNLAGALQETENLDIDATKSGSVSTVTITNKEGITKSVEIVDGEKGEKGEKGNKGDKGADGQDGYTPQKGIDYFTEQDIEEIEGDILNEVYTKSETDTLLDEKADIEDIPDVSSFITKDVNNLTNYTLKTNTGSLIDLEINDTTYVVTLKLKNQDGTIISTDTIDLPLESVVVSGRYDNTTKKVILTLENGSEVDFSVADLVAGLQTEITSSNKLASDLIDDTNSGNKFVTTSEKQTWNNKYDKPNGGIPKTDLASTVQTSLNKADTAIQEHQDISGKEDKTNKVTSLSSSSTDTQYPSAKAVYDYIQSLNGDEVSY